MKLFKIKNPVRVTIFLLFYSIISNCATSTAGLAISNIPVSNKKYKVLGPVENKTYWTSFDVAIIGFPLSKPPINKLITETLQKNEADALINIHYWNDKIIILFITINRFGFNAELIKFTDKEL